MQVSPSGNVNQTAVTAATGQSLKSDDFFKILVAELQNQNPIEPMNDREFISQMAQFQLLEQVQKLGAKVDDLEQTLTARLGDWQKQQQANFEEEMKLLGALQAGPKPVGQGGGGE